jgi:segregation and condensation protein A
VTEAFQPPLDFDAVDAADEREAFVVDLDGYEGPLHVLLALARTQKVDLLALSITRLAEQYLAFVHEARRRNFSLAADYLVMASWLAYLKSRLLLPRTEKVKDEEPPAEAMAAALAFRLRKLEAMRRAVEAITARPQLKRDVFTRGDPEATVIVPSDRIDASLYELMSAYVVQRRREEQRRYNPGQRVEAFAIEAARDWLRDALPRLADWTPLERVAPRRPGEGEGPSQASFTASTLSASLELVKEGAMDVRQDRAFADLWLKRRGLGQPLELTP